MDLIHKCRKTCEIEFPVKRIFVLPEPKPEPLLGRTKEYPA